MTFQEIIFKADEEASSALEFLWMAQRSLHRVGNAIQHATEKEAPASVKIGCDAKWLAGQLKPITDAVVNLRTLVREQDRKEVR